MRPIRQGRKKGCRSKLVEARVSNTRLTRPNESRGEGERCCMIVRVRYEQVCRAAARKKETGSTQEALYVLKTGVCPLLYSAIATQSKPGTGPQASLRRLLCVSTPILTSTKSITLADTSSKASTKAMSMFTSRGARRTEAKRTKLTQV